MLSIVSTPGAGEAIHEWHTTATATRPAVSDTGGLRDTFQSVPAAARAALVWRYLFLVPSESILFMDCVPHAGFAFASRGFPTIRLHSSPIDRSGDFSELVESIEAKLTVRCRRRHWTRRIGAMRSSSRSALMCD